MTRRFTRAEIERILARATAPDGDEPTLGDSAEGVTLAELQGIAAEVGIDPRRVEEAALDVVRPATGHGLVVRSYTRARYEGEYDVKLDDTDRSEALHAVRTVAGSPGKVEVQVGSLEWTDADWLGARYHVAVTPSNRGTRVRVSGDFREFVAGSIGLGALVGGAGAAGVFAAVGAVGAIGWAALPLAAAATLAVPRVALRGVWGNRIDRVREFGAAIEAVIDSKVLE